jgi:hypothetical protein
MDAMTMESRIQDADDVQIRIPYGLYREILEFIDAIGSPLRPDELVADAIRGFMYRSERLLRQSGI